MQRQGHRGGGQDMSAMLYMQMQQHEQQMQVCSAFCALFTYVYKEYISRYAVKTADAGKQHISCYS